MSASRPGEGHLRYQGGIGISTLVNLGMNVTGSTAVATPDNFVQVVRSLAIVQNTSAGTVIIYITNGMTTIKVFEVSLAIAGSFNGTDEFDFRIEVPNGYNLQASTSAGTADVIATVDLIEGGDFS